MVSYSNFRFELITLLIFRIIFAEEWGILFAILNILHVISQAFPGGKLTPELSFFNVLQEF